MSQVLVVNTNAALSLTGCPYSAIGYQTLIPTSTILNAAEDPDYPFANALDYRDNTKYSPLAASGSVVIEFRQAATSEVNYLGFAIHNGQTAGLTGKLEYSTDGGISWLTVFEFSGLTDNKTFMHVFDSVFSERQRLTLNFTSKLYISCIYMGKAKLMDSTPTLGFQPAKFAPLDEVEQFSTEGNNFIIGRRISRGYQAKGTFSYITFDDLNDWYEDYQDHVLDSKPVFFKWNSDINDAVFGMQNPQQLTKPTYKTSFHADIDLEINGYR